MPKVNNTRYDRALKLRELVNRGPSIDLIGSDASNIDALEKETEKQVRNWLESWVLPEINYLIPELRDINKN